ncbi:protein mono-ADP-ribosyltransferase PARP12-like isoform X1 [Mya arenaria]|nr:protein mono-ADP-ribosyltransferase PARP12-like isoform X1 [Mya arenaria]XP_052759705.1 protein mono-ADP-ribosyltransferase PARP12-like isoform X1 [Mya arenaria]XP_052759706.1 protein mono-ADP-ribosyltransferase PARP12-like isoform X1 [Mya arenaria]
MAMKMNQVQDDIVRRVIGLLASQPNNVIGLADLHAYFKSVMKKKQLELLLRNYADQFELFEDGVLFVRLVIKVTLCEMHCSKQTCPGKIPSCTGLHVCKFFILSGNCKFSSCHFGHDLTTSHNMEVLREHLLDQLPMSLVKDLLKHSDTRNAATIPKICKFYNVGVGCRNDEAGKPCPHLHVCKHYLTGTCRFGKHCRRSHNILEGTVRSILEKHGISTKRTPKELLAELREIMQSDDGSDWGSVESAPEPMFARGRPPPGKLIRAMSDMTIQDSGGVATSRRPPMSPAYIGGAAAVTPGRRTPRSATPKTPTRTIRSPSPGMPLNFRRGSPSPVGRMRQPKSDKVSESAADNILNKKICIYHLKSRCSYGAQCFNYHCELPYQWIYRFDDSANWETVEPEENICMELQYVDPANDEYFLFIDGVSVQLKFKTMKAQGGDKHLTFFRLSTETSAILDTQPLATSWEWFWKGQMGDWKKYGDDADGYHSTISSQDLEQAYISNPDGQLKFSTQGHEYILDFVKMVQCNLHYKTEREVTRRPKFISKHEFEMRKKQQVIQKSAGAATSEFVPVAPPHWNLRPTDELLSHCRLVLLDERKPSMKTEYNKIENMFSATMPSTVTIVSISRVENGDLWHNYLSKKAKLKKRNKGVDVEERQLFHGTKNDTMEAIYRQGFDFRLSGTASGTAHGKGSYFATTAKYSDCYTDRQRGTMVMFIAKVLVGDYTKGDKSYTRPPQKDPRDLSSPLYDSCVDSVTDPKIFVIFELGQVYPEYLIKYKYDF